MTHEELTQLAMLYYVEGQTQEVLSERFGISRATVGRMLKQAQRLGIVEIRVLHHPSHTEDLEKQLLERFGIKKALLSVGHQDVDKQRAILAGLVASYLERNLSDGSIVAVGMGRNVNAVSEHVMSTTHKKVSFVCAVGGSYRGGEAMNPDHISRRLATRFGGDSETLYAPALISNAEVKSHLLQNDTIRRTLDKARRADFALIGIGDVSENSNMVRMGWFSSEEIIEAKTLGTVGDIMGYEFIDIHGHAVKSPIQGRVIGLSQNDLLRIPNVIAIAAESSKVTGILGTLRTGTVDILATTASNAMEVLSLDKATSR